MTQLRPGARGGTVVKTRKPVRFPRSSRRSSLLSPVTIRLRTVTAAIACLLAVVAACSGSEDDQAPGGASSVEAGSTTFTSEQAFQIEVPKGWRVNEAYLDWEMGTPPHRGAPSFDTARSGSETGDPWILVGRQHLSRGMTLERWLAKLRETDTITYPDLCEAPEVEKAGALGGEPAQVIALRCPRDLPNSIAVQVLTVHGRGGYLAMCFSEEAAGGRIEVLMADCEEWLSTFRFVD